MTVEVQVPVGGEGAEEYVLVQWYAAEGDRVAEGDTLFEIETAKATYDVPAPADGVLRIAVAAGAEVSAHQVIGTIGGEPAGRAPDSTAVAADVAPAEPSVTVPAVTGPSVTVPEAGGRVPASPRARAAARVSGVDLGTVAGTGPDGRVLARDVPAASASAASASAGQASVEEASAGGARGVAGPAVATATPDRTVIARRMTEAAAAPTVTLHRWCDGTVLRDLAARLRAAGERWGLPRVSIGDLLALVVSRVLPLHPDLNAHWVDGLRRHGAVHLGIAVDAPWGLVVPVLADAQRLSVGELAARRADLAERARARAVARAEITGSTFTLTNLGATGVEHFTPLLNPPEVAILGVGALVPSGPHGAEGGGAVRLPLSLTFDHRAVDGAPAGRFLADVAAGVEEVDVLMAVGEGRPGGGRS